MEKRRAIQALAIAVTLIALVGCQSGNQNQGSTEEAASSTSPNAPTGSSSRREGLRRRSEASGQAAPATQMVTVPAGTEVRIRLSSAISSATASSGTGFQIGRAHV